MTAHLKFILSAAAGLMAAAMAASAQAGPPPGHPGGGYGGGGGCGPVCPPVHPPQPPQPPCCDHRPPTPPPPPPVVCCQPPSPPNVTIVTPPVVAVAISGASASARASSVASSQNYFFGGGGGGGGVAVAGATSAALSVQGAAEFRRVPYQMRRRVERTVVVRAVCVDDRFVPHAASQLFRERDVLDGYVGELYRCIAGTRLQLTMSEWGGTIEASTGGATTLNCGRGEAAWHERGELTCRRATPQRDCFERSRLRLWGAGVKVLRYVREEVVTAYREERVEGSFASGGLVMDGGVGGIQY